MSLTYRLTAGLPAVGVSVLAAVAFSGGPASAMTADLSARAALPAVTATPCADSRSHCSAGYGSDTATDTGTGVTATAPTRGHAGYHTPTPSVTPTTPTGTLPTTSPTTPVQTTPTGITDTVPGEVSPTSSSPTGYGPTTHGRGVSAGGILPVTGPPMGPTIGFGSLFLAAGGAAIWYTRRRRTA